LPYEHKVNTGTVFANPDKEKETSPDFSGTANIAGRVYRIAGWKNRSNDGKVRLNLKFSEPQNGRR
jgi:hypothetical protein